MVSYFFQGSQYLVYGVIFIVYQYSEVGQLGEYVKFGEREIGGVLLQLRLCRCVISGWGNRDFGVEQVVVYFLFKVVREGFISNFNLFLSVVGRCVWVFFGCLLGFVQCGRGLSDLFGQRFFVGQFKDLVGVQQFSEIVEQVTVFEVFVFGVYKYEEGAVVWGQFRVLVDGAGQSVFLRSFFVQSRCFFILLFRQGLFFILSLFGLNQFGVSFF